VNSGVGKWILENFQLEKNEEDDDLLEEIVTTGHDELNAI